MRSELWFWVACEARRIAMTGVRWLGLGQTSRSRYGSGVGVGKPFVTLGSEYNLHPVSILGVKRAKSGNYHSLRVIRSPQCGAISTEELQSGLTAHHQCADMLLSFSRLLDPWVGLIYRCQKVDTNEPQAVLRP